MLTKTKMPNIVPKKRYTLRQLVKGDKFQFPDSAAIYMVLNHIKVTTVVVDAVHLGTGVYCSYEEDPEVYPVDISIEITKRH